MKTEVAKQMKKKHKWFKYNTWDSLQLLLLQLPAIIYVLIFCYIPMYGIIIAFKKFNPSKGIWGSEWIGFKNFEFFFSSQDLWRVTRNTVLYSLWFLFIGTVFAIFIAVLLYNLRSKVLLKAYNTIMILPTFLSMVLISYIVYAILNPADGILNQLFVKLGIGKVDWYADPKPWPAILTVVDQWKGVGMGCIIYYATLVGINPELFEAARVDGANKVQQSWYIAIPELKPVVAIKIIMGFGGLFSGDFGLFYQITRNSAALYPTTDIINTYTFRALTENNDIATSSAIGLVQSVIGLIMILVVNAIIRKISYENRLF